LPVTTDGITKDNTLFVRPSDKTLTLLAAAEPANWATASLPLPYTHKGEIDFCHHRLVLTREAKYVVLGSQRRCAYRLTSPAIPPPTPLTRPRWNLDFNALLATNPITGNTDMLSACWPTKREKLAAHGNQSPARTPTFTMFRQMTTIFFFRAGTGGAAHNKRCVSRRTGFRLESRDFQKQYPRLVGRGRPCINNLWANDDVGARITRPCGPR